jgi:hypothetical protein
MAGTIKGGKAFSMRIDMAEFNRVLTNLSIAKEQGPRLQKALVKEGEAIKKNSMIFVGKKTHRLEQSHRVLTYGAKGKPTIRVDVAAGGISVRGKLVNYAAAHHAVNPYLQAALDLQRPGFEQRMTKAIKLPGRRTSLRFTK